MFLPLRRNGLIFAQSKADANVFLAPDSRLHFLGIAGISENGAKASRWGWARPAIQKEETVAIFEFVFTLAPCAAAKPRNVWLAGTRN